MPLVGPQHTRKLLRPSPHLRNCYICGPFGLITSVDRLANIEELTSLPHGFLPVTGTELLHAKNPHRR
jgi:hypothetical protein